MKAMHDYKPYTLEDIPELPFEDVERRIYATVCEVERLKALLAATEAKQEPTVDFSMMIRPPRLIPRLRALFAGQLKK